MNENNIIDPAATERLCRLGGEKFAVEMMDLFASYGAKKIGAARAAHTSGNLAALAEAAHPIKSSAGNVGAIRVQELATQLESAARAQDAGLAGTQMDELERAFAEAVTFLETAKARLAKPPV
jgi:HPt (histidine-containing phosphotransfer) domain-containing protein